MCFVEQFVIFIAGWIFFLHLTEAWFIGFKILSHFLATVGRGGGSKRPGAGPGGSSVGPDRLLHCKLLLSYSSLLQRVL